MDSVIRIRFGVNLFLTYIPLTNVVKTKDFQTKVGELWTDELEPLQALETVGKWLQEELRPKWFQLFLRDSNAAGQEVILEWVNSGTSWGSILSLAERNSFRLSE